MTARDTWPVGPLLALDTATRTAVVALGDDRGDLVAEERWSSGHRHASELLGRLAALLGANDTALADLAAVVVGIGPGSFTGLRVGLAAAKVIAYSRGIPIVGVSSLEALASRALEAAASAPDDAAADDAAGPTVHRVAVILPAGASDRYLAVVERRPDGLPRLIRPPRLVAAGAGLGDLRGAARLIALDIETPGPNVDAAAIGAGQAALEGLAAGLLALGAARLRAGATTDVSELVPAYVALPRGITAAVSGMAWSPDLR